MAQHSTPSAQVHGGRRHHYSCASAGPPRGRVSCGCLCTQDRAESARCAVHAPSLTTPRARDHVRRHWLTSPCSAVLRLHQPQSCAPATPAPSQHASTLLTPRSAQTLSLLGLTSNSLFTQHTDPVVMAGHPASKQKWQTPNAVTACGAHRRSYSACTRKRHGPRIGACC